MEFCWSSVLLFSQTVPGNGCRIWFVYVCCRLWSQWSPQYSVRSVVQWSFSLSCLACDMFIVAQKTDIRWSRSFRLIFTWLCPSRLTPLNLKEHYISLSLRNDKMMFVFLDVFFSEASVLMKDSLYIELLILTWKENAQYSISSGMYSDSSHLMNSSWRLLVQLQCFIDVEADDWLKHHCWIYSCSFNVS